MNTNPLLAKRDNKSKPHLQQYAPVWITEEDTTPEDSTAHFSVIFQHKTHGWVNRKYHYDGFNNVLYYRGETVIPEEATLATQDREPYIPTLLTDTPNSYGG